uniref:Uncharacterized protein n=1 Tax=Davidia involucrata TaxID=16924 RepID=A0A5B7BNF2_DAVIN
MAAADWVEQDEWEFVNDDGFVYKRKKRRLDPTISAPPPPDPKAEEKNRRERKKIALIKLREKYQKEIDHWDHLSNTLKAMQEKAQNQQPPQHREQTTASSSSAIASPFPPAQSSDSDGRRLVDDLLLRVEAEEAIIHDVTHLCDLAEAICNAHEERTKQSLVDLPIWASPGELMASLCDN